VQRAELFDHEEQKDHAGSAGTKEILSALPEAYAAQRGEIAAIVETDHWELTTDTGFSGA
jgi:hypothetical protein